MNMLGRRNLPLAAILMLSALVSAGARAAPPEMGEAYFEQLVAACKDTLDTVETGRFGANMRVTLTNDGPVTFWLES